VEQNSPIVAGQPWPSAWRGGKPCRELPGHV